MPAPDSQTFLRELDKKLWTAADKLRSNLDAAVYKHAVLGLIFLKYVSDSFAQRQAEIAAMIKDPENDFFIDPDGYDKPARYEDAIRAELEERDYYIEKNVFWVPALARWKTLQDSAKLPAGTEILKERGSSVRSYKITSTGKLIDDALEAVEKENPKLKNVLNKNYTQLQIDPANLAGLIDLIATIPFQHADLHAKDILGHVYDWSGATKSLPKESPKGERGGAHQYFLGQFALAEGKKGGHWSGATKTSPQGSPKGWRGSANQYFTPKSIVSLIVEMIEPYQGRVYDPAMGSGGFFVQSERFIEEHGGTIGDIMVFGQDQWAWGAHLRRAQRARRVRLRRKQPNQSNPTTWRLAAMNMAIRGIDFDFGKEPADTFTRDQHPDLRADFVMANPPFNIKEWWDGKLEGDARWKYGTPPQGNANFAWVQHMLHHLAPNGSMALLLANGSMSSNSSGEGDIRRALIEADLVECMVALPGQLFTNTQIPACIWFLTKNKAKRSRPGAAALRDRRGETLFIDARKLGFMIDRVRRDFTTEDIGEIAGIFRAWRTRIDETPALSKKKNGDKSIATPYEDRLGFCKSANLPEIISHGHVLTPGRFVGAQDVEDDAELFDEKMANLVAELAGQFVESSKLEKRIKTNLKGLGYGE